MTHQLYYDTHSMVDAFLRLLRALENDHPNGFTIFARRLCQDSLESLFGRLRQANGGQRDLSVKSIVDAVDKVEEKSRRKAKRVAALEERRNSGTRADDADGPAAPKKGKKKRKGAAAGAAPAVMALAPAPRPYQQPRQLRWCRQWQHPRPQLQPRQLRWCRPYQHPWPRPQRQHRARSG